MQIQLQLNFSRYEGFKRCKRNEYCKSKICCKRNGYSRLENWKIIKRECGCETGFGAEAGAATLEVF